MKSKILDGPVVCPGAVKRCSLLLVLAFFGFFHVFHFRPSHVWHHEDVVTGNASGRDPFSEKLHETCRRRTLPSQRQGTLETPRVHPCRPRTSCNHSWRLSFEECTSKKPWCSASRIPSWRCHRPPAQHGRRLASSRACCVVHRHRYPKRRCQCRCLRHSQSEVAGARGVGAEIVGTSLDTAM